MGESYLKRKLFSKSRSLQMSQTSSIGSISANSSFPSAFPLSSSSSSAAKLNEMIRNYEMTTNEEEDVIERRRQDEEITTAPATKESPSTSSSGDDKHINTRLKTTSKAILFFRRAATAFRGTKSDNNNNNSNSNSNSNTLSSPLATILNRSSGSAMIDSNSFSRQNTSDSQNSANSQASTNILGALNGPNNSAKLKNKEPQFIVPKLIALKMPLVCLIKSLDGELMQEVFVHRYELGQYLIENLKVSLGIEDSKYFGLKMSKSCDDQEDLRNPWLDLNESVCKQIKQQAANNTKNGFVLNNMNTNEQQQNYRSIDFYLRIKFYPPNLARVRDSFLRHYLWLQLRRDLRLGKLTSSMNNLTLLMACILQYELGDYGSKLVEKIPQLNILPNQDLIEEQAIEVWRDRLSGFRKHQAQMQFLRAAVILETYGFEYYPVRDHQRQRAYLLGFNYAGIKSIRNGRIVHHLRWHSLSKICYERRMIIFHQYPSEKSKRKQVLGFKCLLNEDCQNLYLRLLEQKYFFTVDLAYFDKSIQRPSCIETDLEASTNWRQISAEDNQEEPGNHFSRSSESFMESESSSQQAAVGPHNVGLNQRLRNLSENQIHAQDSTGLSGTENTKLFSSCQPEDIQLGAKLQPKTSAQQEKQTLELRKMLKPALGFFLLVILMNILLQLTDNLTSFILDKLTAFATT